jgi:hypothetical protein
VSKRKEQGFINRDAVVRSKGTWRLKYFDGEEHMIYIMEIVFGKVVKIFTQFKHIRKLREALHNWKPIIQLTEIPKKTLFSKGNSKASDVEFKQRKINTFL